MASSEDQKQSDKGVEFILDCSRNIPGICQAKTDTAKSQTGLIYLLFFYITLWTTVKFASNSSPALPSISSK